MSSIGEAGHLNENTTYAGEELHVSFSEPLTDPVITMMSSNFGGHKFSLRVTEIETNANGDATGFKFTIDEWENHDGKHPVVEEINWIAIESGVHVLPDGRVIEAGYAEADSDGEKIEFSGDFTGPPTVLTTVASNSHASNVDSDPSAVSKSGFNLCLEEAASQDGIHGAEKVGWIAVQHGTGEDSGSSQIVHGIGSGWADDVDLDGEFTNAITVGETQTKNDTHSGNVIFKDTGDGSIDLRFEEETTMGGDTGHHGETVGLVTFEQGLVDGVTVACFADDCLIETAVGPRPAGDIRAGDLVTTLDNGLQPVVWAGSRAFETPQLNQMPDLWPIEFDVSSIAPGVPNAKMKVSPQHRILVRGWLSALYAGADEVLVPAKALVNDATIRSIRPDRLRYVHLLFDEHQIICANTVWSESLHPGTQAQMSFSSDAKKELKEMFPDLEHFHSTVTARPVLTVKTGKLLFNSMVSAKTVSGRSPAYNHRHD